jgi:uncharacterized protein YbcI
VDRAQALLDELGSRFCGVLEATGGRSPARCRVFVAENIVTVVCEQTLNPSEKRTFHSSVEAVARSRRAIQRMVRLKATPVVEELTGARVVASTSGHAIDPDIGVYNFVLSEAPALAAD